MQQQMYYANVPPPGTVPAQMGYVDPMSAYGGRPYHAGAPVQNAPPFQQAEYSAAGPSREQYPYAQSRAPSWGSIPKDDDVKREAAPAGGKGGGGAGAASASAGASGAAGSGAGAGGASGGSSGGGGGGSSQQPGPSEFIKKLFKMLEDESATYGRGKPAGAPRLKGERGSVGWGRKGTSFVVWDMNEFTTKVL